MYTKWMDRIESQDEYDKNLAKQALALVVCSKRALTPEELRYALAIHEGDTNLNERGLCDIDDIISLCEGLIVISQETDTVRLVHGATAAEFFNAHLSDYFPEAELYVASTCMTILNFTSYTEVADFWRICATPDERPTLEENAAIEEEFHQQFEKLPFLRYAAFYWPQHLRTCGQKLLDPAVSFIESGSRFRYLFYQMWSHFDDYIPHPENTTVWLYDGEDLLLTCARLGLTCVYETMLDRDPENRLFNLNRTDTGGRTALLLATRRNHAGMVGFLVKQQGLNITLGPKSNDGLTPLDIACREGNPEILAELLKHPDLTVNTRIRSSSTPWLSSNFDLPIHIATKRGHLRLVQHLVETEEYNQDADAENGNHKRPLQIACYEGHEAVVSYLLGIANVDVNAGIPGETPLCIAIERGPVSITRMLMQRPDIDLHLPIEHGGTALHRAAGIRNSLERACEISKILLQRKVLSVEARTVNGDTPLSIAVLVAPYGEVDLIDYLISQEGANVQTVNNQGETLLHSAVKGGRIHPLKYLVENYQLDIYVKDHNGQTPFDFALERTQLEIFDFLIDLHLKGARLRIIGQSKHVSDKGYGEYIMRRYKCSLALTETHRDCGLCTDISERLHIQSFYLDEDHALVEEARELWPSTWCINPKGEESEESDGSVIETEVSQRSVNTRSEELEESDDGIIETKVSKSCITTRSEELEEAEEPDGSAVENEVSRMILIAE